MIITMLTLALSCSQAERTGKVLYPGNREPLTHKPYMELPLGAVRPEGWLKDQLERMAKGMTGHLDSLYPQVMGKRNGWLGGNGDMWERGPYWIDGLVPLAYILDDPDLKAKVQPWIEWALSSQRNDGYFGPSVDLDPEKGLQRNRTQDWWPRIVVLKFLKQYYDATSDERIIPFMTRYFHYQLDQLPAHPLNHWSVWAQERGGDNLMLVYWLYNITGEKFLLDLGDLLARQTSDWKSRFSDRTTLTSLFALHCVDLAQGLKEPVVRYQATKDTSYISAIDTGLADIRRTIGWPTGLYGADEMLHSGNPTQGSELCSAVEMMFSLEKMIEITGRTDWADLLERVAYNTLPTQITDNFDARQYYQQINQVDISIERRNFMTSYQGTAQSFGLLTGFPCCTSNLHQGWPKFTRNLWYASDDGGLSATAYAPCRVSALVGDGVQVTVREETDYPFDGQIRFLLNIEDRDRVAFPLHLRIPGWCTSVTVSVNGETISQGKAGEGLVLNREWSDGDILVLDLPMRITISRWYENSAVVERGPLVYALKIGEQWDKIQIGERFDGQFGEWCYQVHATTPWNYCLLEKDVNNPDLDSCFQVEQRKLSGYPWNPENAPIQILAKGKRLPSWKMYNGSTGPIPYSLQYQEETGPEETLVLIPYGCTTLRITEFPVTSK